MTSFYLPASPYLSPSLSLPVIYILIIISSLFSSSPFYTVKEPLCLSSISLTLWILLYPDKSSMARQRSRRRLRGHRGRGRRHLALPPVSTIPPGPINLHQHTACNLCNENIYSFSTTDIAELIYRNSPKDADGFSNGPWIHGRSTDMDDVHFDEMWTWSCMLRACKCFSNILG